MSMPRLITLAPSHFSEKTRWALDRLAIPYEEDTHAPVAHLLALRKVGGRSVPTLVLPGGRVIKDSSDTLVWADEHAAAGHELFPEPHRAEVLELEDEFDETLGPAVSRWIHTWVFDRYEDLARVLGRRVSAARRRWFPLLLPMSKRYFLGRLASHRKTHEEHHRHLRHIWAATDRRLADGRRYLVGDRFTAADLTLAALAAHAVAAPEFGGGLLPFDRLPLEAREHVAGFRATPTGRLVLRLYREERGVVLGGAARTGASHGAVDRERLRPRQAM